MQLKKYQAPTIHEALKKIKAELGEDAVIFDSRSIMADDSLPRRQSRPWVEVTAAIERKAGKGENKELPGALPAAACFNSAHGHAGGEERSARAFAGAYNGFSAEHGKSFPVCEETFFPYLKNMLCSGINRELAWYLLGEASAEYRQGGAGGSLDTILLQKIGCRIPVVGRISVPPGQKKIIAFIGPTGVGKTTTLAKIAAQSSADTKIKVKIVTMDTYRIAAVEQLKIYAKIMGLPMAVAASKQELAREIEVKDDTNLMLIDTAGRNFRDKAQIAELGSWLRRYKEIEAHLLLSATTSEDVLLSTLQCFQSARVDRIILTKVDESVKQGHLFNLVASSKIPVSYVTTGQRVPEDIMPATAKNLSGMFLNGFAN